MRVRLPIGSSISEAGLTSAVTSLPGVRRTARQGHMLVIDYDPNLVSLTDITHALDTQFDRAWRAASSGFMGRLTGLLTQAMSHLTVDAEAIQTDAASRYPVGFRQRLHEIYLHRYRHRRHGLRGERRGNWRHYLNRPTESFANPDGSGHPHG